MRYVYIHTQKVGSTPIQHTSAPQRSNGSLTPRGVKEDHNSLTPVQVEHCCPASLAQTSAWPFSFRAFGAVDKGLQAGLKVRPTPASAQLFDGGRVHSAPFSNYLLMLVTPLYPLPFQSWQAWGTSLT